MTFDEEFESYDPVVAERFSLLDRATRPEPNGLPLRPASSPVVGIGTRTAKARPWHHLAAAAAVAAVAGASVVAITQRGDEQDVQATTGDGISIEADEASATENNGEPKSLTVEVPAADGAATGDNTSGSADAGSIGQAGADGQQDGAGSPGEAGSTTTTKGQDSDGSSNDGGTGSDPTETTGSTEAPGSSTTEGVGSSTTTGSDGPTTTAPGTAQTTTTRDMTPGSSWLNPPTPEKMITIRGKVTEVFTDCMSRLVLNDAGEVESIGPVSCDGGSYIIVNGTRIQTSSGFTSNDDYFGKHPESLRPGQTVTVSAVPTGASGQIFTLDCVQCEVRLAG